MSPNNVTVLICQIRAREAFTARGLSGAGQHVLYSVVLCAFGYKFVGTTVGTCAAQFSAARCIICDTVTLLAVRSICLGEDKLGIKEDKKEE